MTGRDNSHYTIADQLFVFEWKEHLYTFWIEFFFSSYIMDTINLKDIIIKNTELKVRAGRGGFFVKDEKKDNWNENLIEKELEVIGVFSE